MLDTTNKLAVVTGASTGIGFELAKECSRNGFDLIIAANEREIEDAKAKLGTQSHDEWRRRRGDRLAKQAAIGHFVAHAGRDASRATSQDGCAWNRAKLSAAQNISLRACWRALEYRVSSTAVVPCAALAIGRVRDAGRDKSTGVCSRIKC